MPRWVSTTSPSPCSGLGPPSRGPATAAGARRRGSVATDPDPSTRRWRVDLLVAESVSVKFGGNMAVIDASVNVAAGEVTGLIGPNGAGKTTLFNVLNGLQHPVTGKVVLNGIDITRAAPHERAQRGLARTFQRIELFGSLTARENLQVAAEIKRSFGNQEKVPALKRVEETIEF